MSPKGMNVDNIRVCNCRCTKDRLFTQNREGLEIGLLLLGAVLGSVGSLAADIALRVLARLVLG